MKNVSLSTHDATPRDVVGIGTDYTPGQLLDTHQHRRAQFLYGATGLMEVGTDDGAWVVPPHCGVWIPAHKPHSVRMVGVSTRSLYIEPAVAPRAAERCEVLPVSPLLRQLLLEAVDAPALYEVNGRDGLVMRLALAEIGRAAPLPFFAPLPADPALRALCAAFLRQPHIRSRATRIQRLDVQGVFYSPLPFQASNARCAEGLTPRRRRNMVEKAPGLS